MTEVLMSKIMWHMTNWNPCGLFLPSSSELNATLTFFISLAMTSAQREEPDHLSMARALSTNFGRGRPYLCVLFKYLTLRCFTSKMMVSLFLRNQNTHQLKPGSSATPICIANSVLGQDGTLWGWTAFPRRWSHPSICNRWTNPLGTHVGKWYH